MKLTETLDEDISAFEKATGKTVSPELRVVLVKLAAVGDRFEDLGRKDALDGRGQRTMDAFIEWGKRELIDPEGKDCPIVELMYDCYIDGYNAGSPA